MSFIKIFFIIIIFQYIFGCVEKTTYSGKIITDDDLNLKILDKSFDRLSIFFSSNDILANLAVCLILSLSMIICNLC